MRRLRLLTGLMCLILLALSAGLIFAQTDEPDQPDATEEPAPAAPTEEPADAETAEPAPVETEAVEPEAPATEAAAEPTPEVTEEAAPAEYVGSRRCFGCHRDVGQPHFSSPHALTLQEPDDEVIAADFEQGEDVRSVQLPGEEEARPFTAEDIAYVVGTGTYAQQYVVAEEGEDATRYWVLPALWNAVDQAWQPYGDGGEWPGDAYDWTQNCAGCHTTGLDAESGEWIEVGVQCESCHGPGSNHFALIQEFGNTDDPDELEQIRSAIVLSPDAQICGACHSQGEGPDDHPYPIGYTPGETLVSGDTFELFPPDDEAHWWATGHGRQKYMQFNEWMNSGHPRSLQVLRARDEVPDACLSCHSGDASFTARIIEETESGERPGTPPEPTTFDTARFGITCTSCHTIHLPVAEDAEDQAAQGYTFMLPVEPYEQCTACHRNTEATGGIHHPAMEMFEGADVVDEVDGTPSAHFTAAEGPKCATCHMPRVPVDGMGSRASHVMGIVAPGDALDVEGIGDSCSACHSTQANPAALQDLIDAIQTNTQDRLDTARDAVGDGTPDWIVQALDFVEGDGSQGIHNYAYSDRLLDAVELELGLAARPTLEATAPPDDQAQPTPTLEVVAPPAEEGAAPEQVATDAAEQEEGE